MSAVRSAAQAFLITIFVGGLLGPVYTVATALSGTDPLLGAHAASVCPKICEGCHGPYEVRGGTRVVNGPSQRAKPSKTYCQPPKGSLDDVDDLQRYEYPGSIWILIAGYAVVVPLVFGMAFAALRLYARRKSAGA